LVHSGQLNLTYVVEGYQLTKELFAKTPVTGERTQQ
jgi:hypothetical protein